MGIGALAFALTVLAFDTLQFTSQPALNSDYSQVRIQLTPGATLAQTEAVSDAVARLLDTAPEVEAAFSDVNVGDANLYLT